MSTRSTRDTASSRRIHVSSSSARRLGSRSSARRRKSSTGLATRRRRAPWRASSTCQSSPAPSRPSSILAGCEAFAAEYGYPMIIKAAFGGGGSGMRVVRAAEELKQAYESASNEALTAFGDGSVFIERYVDSPRHVEVQILADGTDTIHLFERDCSVAPPSEGRRGRPCDWPAGRRDEGAMGGCGTDHKGRRLLLRGDGRVPCRPEDVEPLFHRGARNNSMAAAAPPPQPYHRPKSHISLCAVCALCQVNPRIQVEHTVTEVITGVDLVQSQIRVAAGQQLKDIGLTQENISEARLCHPSACHDRGSCDGLHAGYWQAAGVATG